MLFRPFRASPGAGLLILQNCTKTRPFHVRAWRGETSRAEGVGRGMLNDVFLRPDGAVVMLSLSQATNISFGCACHRLIQMVLRGVC